MGACTGALWYAPDIDCTSIAGNHAVVSATATTAQGVPDDDDRRRWVIYARVYGPRGGHRPSADIVLDAEQRDALLDQLQAEPS